MSNITGYKCKKCGRLTYPQRIRCLKCKSTEFEEIPFPENGEIVTFTELSQLPWGIDDPYLVFGIVKFENGIKALGLITATDVSIGDKVKASWEKIRIKNGEPIYGWRFTPTLS